MPHSWSQDLYDYKKPRESQNWTNISLKTKPANGPDLPLVLLIGDSITVRYSSEVGAALKDKAYVSLLGTSKAASDPALLDEIKLVLRQNVYSVIHFNLGLHGDVADVRTGLPDVIATLKRYAPLNTSPKPVSPWMIFTHSSRSTRRSCGTVAGCTTPLRERRFSPSRSRRPSHLSCRDESTAQQPSVGLPDKRAECPRVSATFRRHRQGRNHARSRSGG
jgi:hypothetical protein